MQITVLGSFEFVVVVCCGKLPHVVLGVQTRSRGAQEMPPFLLSQINPAAISQSTQNYMKV